MNLETKPAPRLITLPYGSSVDVPSTKPHFFLEGFAEWIDAECTDALEQLRRLSFRAAETDVSAVYAAKRSEIEREKNDPFGSFLSATPGDTDFLADFFFLHLEVAKHQHTLDRLKFLHEMTLESVYEHEFDEDAREHFAAQFDIYLAQSETWYQNKWHASGLIKMDLCRAVLSGEPPSPWHGDSAPTVAADWVREFEQWLHGKGFGRCDLNRYIPSATLDEFAAMKADGGRMSSLYLLESSGDELRFLCDDPRTFNGWGALSGKWEAFLGSRFFDSGARRAAWEAWQEAQNAPGLDDGISELEAI